MGTTRVSAALAPVFIVGDARSGTTLLYRLVQQQPAFGPAPVQLAESNLTARLLNSGRLDTNSWPLRNFLDSDPEAWARFLRVTRHHRWLRRRAVRWTAVTRHPLLTDRLGFGSIARSYVAIASQARGCGRLVEKSPHAIEDLDHLLRWFPDGVFVHIVRDPVDVLASYRSRGRRDASVAHWASFGAAEVADRWERRARRALQAAQQHPDRFLLIRYADLVSAPEAVVRAVCRLAGAPFDPAALGASGGRPEQGRFGDAAIWDPPDRGVGVTWSDTVTQDEAVWVRRRLGALMGEVGVGSQHE